MSKKPLEIDGVIGSQLRDSQGEMLSVEGADITELEAGRGRFNDNHGKGFFNSVGRVTAAKKILKEEDCDDPRHKYYWDKLKTPFVYAKGFLYNDEDHPNAKAAAAILKNIHKNDVPLKLKASVEGGITARGKHDKSLLAATKIHSVALTFTPANKATLIEPISLEKTAITKQEEALIKSVMHLAQDDVPSFIDISKALKMEKIKNNIYKINDLVKDIKDQKVNKALTAGYGGAGTPTDRTGGSVMQTEALETGQKGFKRITCDHCGVEQIMSRNQVKCRDCGKSWSLAKIYDALVRSK